jgi:hypothetical protein
MKRLFPPLSVAALVALGFAPAPAAAQDQPGDKIQVLEVYGEDPCPTSTENEIVVCERLDEEERYRIPKALRGSNSPANEAWASKVRSYESVGDFGPLSCTPIGAGGDLGCTAQMIAAAYAERRGGPGVRAAELVAAAREERLSTIDAEAAATQARVEELERQYMERLERERGGEAPESEAPASEPRVVDPLAMPPPE